MAVYQDKALYLYLDEAGNFDFSPKGSKFFIMTCVTSERPFNDIHQGLLDIKYDCFENSLPLERFHATEDKQATRDKVYGVICGNLDSFEVDAVIIRKNKTNPKLQAPGELYSKVFTWLIKWTFNNVILSNYNRVIVVTDTLPSGVKRKNIEKPLKSCLQAHLSALGIPYSLFHHTSSSDLNLQITDYFCWAIQRKWERDDCRSYDLIKDAVQGEGDLFKCGETVYYDFERNIK